jgi:RNA polymerase sigma-70 factor (ECF subfamily)
VKREAIEFVSKARKGDIKAFEYLINLEKDKLYRLAFTYVKNEEDALEIFQETVVKALEKMSGLKNEHYFSTWLTKILINTSMDHLNFKKKLRHFDENESAEKIIEDIKGDIEGAMDLIDAFKQINPKSKSVLYLRYYKDLKVNEIAKILDWPSGTVKTTIHRGLAELKYMLEGKKT